MGWIFSMKTRKELSGLFGLSNWGAPVPFAAMGDLGEKQVWGGSEFRFVWTC